MSTRSFPSALPSVANTGSPRGRPLCFSRSTVLTGSSFSALSWPVEGGGSERPSPPLPLPLVCVFIGVCALSVHRFFFFACKRRFLTASPPQSPTCVVAGRGDHRNNDRCLCHPRHQRRVQRGRPCACPVIKALFFLLLPCADSQPTHPGRSRQPSRPSSAACS